MRNQNQRDLEEVSIAGAKISKEINGGRSVEGSELGVTI